MPGISMLLGKGRAIRNRSDAQVRLGMLAGGSNWRNETIDGVRFSFPTDGAWEVVPPWPLYEMAVDYLPGVKSQGRKEFQKKCKMKCEM